MECLEIELDELIADTQISRTASGSQFETRRTELDLSAVLVVTDHLLRGGFLKIEAAT